MEASLNLKLVSCTREFWDFVRVLRNDPANLPGFIESTFITPQMQEEYMQKNASNYNICLSNSTPIGFIGDIQGDIRVCVKEEWKKNGIGKFMIKEYVKNKKNLFAKIKIENQGSRKLFESCGFKPKFIIYEL